MGIGNKANYREFKETEAVINRIKQMNLSSILGRMQQFLAVIVELQQSMRD